MRSSTLPLALCASLICGCAGSYRLDDPITEQRAPLGVLSLQWQKAMAPAGFNEYRPQQWASAVVDTRRGIIYVGSTAGRFEALRATDGKRIWSVEVRGGVASQPLLHEPSGAVYFGSENGEMYAVDALTGKVRWRYSTAGTINPRPAYCEGVLLFTSNEGRIYALDAETGKWRWQYDREAPEGFTIHGYSGVTVRGTTAFAGFSDGYLVAFRVFSGDVIWARSLKGGKDQFIDVDATPVISNDLLLTTSYASGVYALSPDTGSIMWNYPVVGASDLAVQDDVLYFSAPRAGVVALNRATGKPLWRQAIAKGIPSTPVVHGPYLFLGGTENGLFVASSKTGRLLQRFDLGWGISAVPALGRKILVVLSNGGTLSTFKIDG